MKKIIQIASFKGNIGDIVNHEGFYFMLKKFHDHEIKIEKIEIRDFYFSSAKRRVFDNEFADYINSFDMCVLGGGSFFDLQWNESSTGTTFDFKDCFIDKLKIPVLVNGMGYHEFTGVTNDRLCEKFRNFISDIRQRENWLITVRNDGSFERLSNRYSSDISSYIMKIPDHGFFCEFNRKSKSKIGNTTIGMCISNDLFSESYNKKLRCCDLNKHIAGLIDNRRAIGNRIVLFTHTPQDIGTVNEIFANLSSEAKRSSVIVAPYDSSGPEAVDEYFSYYSRCDLVIGMRFHSLVTAINLGIPAIALCGHTQIEALFKELDLSDLSIRADTSEFACILDSMIDNVILNKEKIKEKYKKIYDVLNYQEEEYQKAIKKFLK